MPFKVDALDTSGDLVNSRIWGLLGPCLREFPFLPLPPTHFLMTDAFIYGWKGRGIQWCLRWRISLSAVHISGFNNVKADPLSRRQAKNPCWLEHSTEWSLDFRVTSLLSSTWGLPTVDLFTTRLNNKVEMFPSRLPDPCPPVLCSSQGDSGGGSSHHDSTMAAPK